MPKRKSSHSPRATLILAGITAFIFLFGEGLVVLRQDWGQLLMTRVLGFGDRAKVTRLIGIQIHRGLDQAGIPRDSVEEKTSDQGSPGIRWRVGLAPSASLIQANYAITKNLADQGAAVISGRERPGRSGETLLTLVAGINGRPTHEVTLVRWPRTEDAPIAFARVAILVYGMGDDLEQAEVFINSPYPFAVALVPGAPGSEKLFRMAREREREMVLHLPLEPIGYPQTNPGPGTILVTMNPLKITGTVKHYLDVAGPVTAVANHMGSLATQDMTVMRAVFRELKRRELPFLHIAPAVGSVCRSLAGEMGVPYALPQMVLDTEARQKTTVQLDAAWKRALDGATEDGKMIVMIRATPLVLEWLPKATTTKRLKNVSVVPLAALLARHAAL